MQFCVEKSIPFVAGAGMNVFNSSDVALILQNGADAFFYSNELTIAECAAFANRKGFKFVDGNLKLMHFTYCPNKLNTKQTCATCTFDSAEYVDELSNTFVIRRRKMDKCTFELLNGKKLSVGKQKVRPFNYCFDFDRRVCDFFKRVNDGEDAVNDEQLAYTKGRLFNPIN